MYKAARMPMAATPSLPPPFVVQTFLGVDFTNVLSDVSPNRSPHCVNMIRTTKGVIKKRTGYQVIKEYEGRINGIHTLYGDTDRQLVHAGTRLYYGDTVVCEGLKDDRSVAKQVNGKLYILDGKKLLAYGKFKEEYSVVAAEEIAYIPVILIARTPKGGGTPLEPINLLQPKRTEKYSGDGTSKIYQLSANNIDITPINISQLNSDGSFIEIMEGSGFTVNRTTGQITFSTPPPISPASEPDNIYITYSKTVDKYRDRINACNLATLYGVNGARDRLFITGNPEQPNCDYYSQLNDPTYFGDLWYSVIGQDNSKIMGYSVVNDVLATHKNRSDDDTNIILRRGNIQDGQAIFTIAGSLQGVGAVSSYSFQTMENEPVFLSKEGVYAITSQDISGERYSQLRSFYINGKLLKEPNLSQAVSVMLGRFYYLALNNRVYILDGEQVVAEANAPYSNRQYECYYWEDVPLRVWSEAEGMLQFGTDDGRICQFYSNNGRVDVYEQGGEPIYCCWTTPYIYSSQPYAKKTFRYFGAILTAEIRTSIRVFYEYRGILKELVKRNTSAEYFDFNYLDFERFTFDTDPTPRTLGKKIKVKNVDKIAIKIENAYAEPFGIENLWLEYQIGGKYAK